jgi:putative sterol carrier protein
VGNRPQNPAADHQQQAAAQGSPNPEDAMSVENIAAQMKDKVASSGFDRSVKFDLKGEGVIVIDGATVSTTDGPADCTITMSMDDFKDLIAGELNPTAAFMTGKIKIAGDMSVAMALSQIL